MSDRYWPYQCNIFFISINSFRIFLFTLIFFVQIFHMDADDDDVRIIDKPTSTSKVKRGRARVIRSALDDDECCILDTDPGADATLDIVTSLDTDELVMTGEKGPVSNI